VIQATVVGTPEATARLRGVTPALLDDLEHRMMALTIAMQSSVKANKLSGQVLHRRTGTLSRAVHQDVTRDDRGVVGRVYVGPEAPYGRVHEKGLTVQVPEHRRTITQAFGRPIEPTTVTVRAHSAHFPERAFLRPTLEEYRAEFLRQVSLAARAAAGR
jgi:hypothetical protein